MSETALNQKGWKLDKGGLTCPKCGCEIMIYTNSLEPNTYKIGDAVMCKNYCLSNDAEICYDDQHVFISGGA